MDEKEGKPPKPIGEDIKLQQEDRTYTDRLRSITLQIETLIQNEENVLTKFCEDFSSISNWIISQTGFLDANVKNQIVAECQRLSGNADANLELLNNIKTWTESEERANSKKIMIKVEIEHDYNEQKRLIKVLKYPRDVVNLVQEIIEIIEESKKETQEDVDIEQKTQQFLATFENSITIIKQNLEAILQHLEENTEIMSLQTDIQQIIGKVQEEISAFKCLDNMERIHLQLLLAIYQQESESLVKQTILKGKAEDKADLELIQEDFV